jgi:hypothetical protein
MRTHHQLTDSGVKTRDATKLTGIIRSTAARDKSRPAAPDPTAAAVTCTQENKLTDAERRTVLFRP